MVGEEKGGLWLARLRWQTRGGAASVEIDWEQALAREEARGDVVGFMHTHPDGCPDPSARDRRTMEAWCICFGKPLLCVIRSGRTCGAWLYSEGYRREAMRVALFRNRWVVVSRC